MAVLEHPAEHRQPECAKTQPEAHLQRSGESGTTEPFSGIQRRQQQREGRRRQHHAGAEAKQRIGHP
ncbi:hypothetical protein D3C78_652040 [compost metagenome]